MTKSINGRLAELERIANHGPAEIVYSNTGFIPPNRWISNAIIKEFLERGLIEQKGTQAEVTRKGIQMLKEKP